MVGDQAGSFPYALIQLNDLLVVFLIGRTDPLSLTPMHKTVVTKTTIGHIPQPIRVISIQILSLVCCIETCRSRQCKYLAELSRQDLSLFYVEVPLFEYELLDNGASSFNVRILINYSFFRTVP